MFIEVETSYDRVLVSLDGAAIRPGGDHGNTRIVANGVDLYIAEPYDSIRRRINEAGLLIGLMPKEAERKEDHIWYPGRVSSSALTEDRPDTCPAGSSCPMCGYWVREGFGYCPNCGRATR